jgi:hypothetical protein
MPFPLLPLAIGAGLGAISHFTSPKKQTASSDISPEMQQYRRALLQAGFGLAGQPLQFYGVPGYQAGSGLSFGGQAPNSPASPFFGRGGSLGFNAPNFTAPPDFASGSDPWVAGAGDPTQYISKFQNPYQQEVIGGIQGDFDRQRGTVTRMADDAATRARAFGGSRHAILASRGLSDIAREEGQALGQFRYSGFNDALERSIAENERQRGVRQNEIDAARYRFDAAQNYPYQQLGFLSQLYGGMPQGQTTTQPLNRNFLGSIAGGAQLGLGFGTMFGRQPNPFAGVPAGF